MESIAQAIPYSRISGSFSGPRLGRGSPSPGDDQAPQLRTFPNLAVHLDARSQTYWCYMRPVERPSFTPALLADLAEMQRSLKALAAGPDGPIRYYILGSRLPGIFNLGGDLTELARKIRSGDRSGLARYARACIDVLYVNAISFDLPVVTVALVQGDALGGGFEAALSCDVIVAERGARFGLPEVLFNLFPGMGAYSFLSRRLGAARAEKMILSGHIYTAEELYDMDVVQILAEPGAGEEAARAFIARSTRRHNAQSAVFRAGRCVAPLRHAELQEVAALWVEAALALGEADLRKMERLTAAQNRRWRAPGLSSAA